MKQLSPADQQCFEDFLSGKSGERVFVQATGHPSQPTGCCPCDRSWAAVLWFYAKAAILAVLLKLPFNGLKIAYLRALGANLGRHVFISVDVWIDPAFPQLLTIEDNVMIGVGAKIALHEFGQREFRAGRVVLRRGAIIGGFAIIGHGVEIGEGATVAGGAAVQRDVPARATVIGNPARILQHKNEVPSQTQSAHE